MIIYIPVDMYFAPAIRCWKNVKMTLKSALTSKNVYELSINQHKCLYSVPATDQQKRRRLRFIFNDNVPAVLPISLHVCANHFTSDCFSNEGQYKAGFASTLTLVKGSVSTIPDPATAPEPPISVGANSIQEFGDCVGDKHSFR